VLNVISARLAVQPVADAAAGGTHTERISVHAIANSYPQMRALITLIRSACHGFHGSVAGVSVGRISAELVGPAMRDDDMSLFSQSIDFLVITYPD
jgi:hypothetical protein